MTFVHANDVRSQSVERRHGARVQAAGATARNNPSQQTPVLVRGPSTMISLTFCFSTQYAGGGGVCTVPLGAREEAAVESIRGSGATHVGLG